jgi:hypothetical protein
MSTTAQLHLGVSMPFSRRTGRDRTVMVEVRRLIEMAFFRISPDILLENLRATRRDTWQRFVPEEGRRSRAMVAAQ